MHHENVTPDAKIRASARFIGTNYRLLASECLLISRKRLWCHHHDLKLLDKQRHREQDSGLLF